METCGQLEKSRIPTSMCYGNLRNTYQYVLWQPTQYLPVCVMATYVIPTSMCYGNLRNTYQYVLWQPTQYLPVCVGNLRNTYQYVLWQPTQYLRYVLCQQP